MIASPLERTRAPFEQTFGVGELIVRYLLWHYSRALIDTVVISGNLLWFLFHLFSIPLHLRTLFSPWRRVKDPHYKGESVEDFFATVVFNFASRLIGFVVRLIIIALGLVVLAGMLVLLLAWFLIWLVLPVASLVTMFIGIMLLV